MLIHEYLQLNAERFPDKVALKFGDGQLTYRDIDTQANRLAHALISAGLKRADRVSIFLDNSPEAVIALYAVLKAGGVFSTLSATLKSKKLEYILDNSGASFLISHRQKGDIVAAAAAGCRTLKKVIMCGAASDRPDHASGHGDAVAWDTFIADRPGTPPAENNCIDIDLANIVYTSGSTGNPKGVMMTHLNMASAASSIIQYLENRASDVILDVLPLSFDYGLYQVIMAFMFGGTIILEKSFAYPYVVIDKLIKEKVTGFPIVPTILAILLQLKNLDKYNFQHLRYISNTGAALPVHHIKQLRELFPRVKIYSMYGLTECKRVSYLPPEEIDNRPASVGKGMPNEEVYIVNESGEKVGPGVVGELVVRGSNVMRGYWKSPADTDRVLKDGPYPGEKVLYTGDLFRMDEEGYLYFVARKDDLIKTRGERVSPKEVENVLHEIEGVAEAAVIGVPDEILGNAVKAFIVSANEKRLQEKDIIRFCQDNLEAFMVPKYVVFVDSFAKTSSGKIDKKLLK